MNLYIPARYLKKLKAADDEESVIHDVLKYKDDDNSVSMDSGDLTEEELIRIQDMAEKGLSKKEEGALSLVQKLTTLRKLTSDPAGVKINRLESLATAARSFIAKNAPHHWLFTTTTEGYVIPYFVDGIEYNAPTRDNKANTQISLAAIARNERCGRTIRFYSDELQNKTVPELLKAKGYFLESEELVKTYEKQMIKYKTLFPLSGEQFIATGTAVILNGRWGRDRISMEREGIATKVILDDRTKETNDDDSTDEQDEISVIVHDKFWNKKKDKDDEDEGAPVALPVHPLVKVFDLDRHEFVIIHTDNLTPYVYDDTLIHKLILAEEKKSLVHMLVAGSTEHMSDIIKGKMRGIIVIATGSPGTGKTLTAEVFSEEIKRPLYVVQCSQLGTNEEELEKELTKVLARASRWKAILLIDEADVYIHERGSDIQQNAIVGVFLRVLEYYRGVLFMTSNRATIIDDAIMSRATAWIQYDKPKPEELKKIWKVLSTNYKIDLDESVIDVLVKAFPTVSGRTVRNLLKLSRLLAVKQNKKVDFDLVRYVSQFQDLGDEKTD